MFALGRSPFAAIRTNQQLFALPNAGRSIGLIACAQIPALTDTAKGLAEREVALNTPLVLRQNGAIFHVMACLNQADKEVFARTNSVHNTQVALARDNPIIWEINAGRKPLFKIMIERRKLGLLGGGSLDELIALLETSYRAQKIQYLDLRGDWEVTDEQLQRLLTICAYDSEVFLKARGQNQEEIDDLFSLFKENGRSLSIEIINCSINTLKSHPFIKELRVLLCPQLTSITGEFSQAHLIDIFRCDAIQTLATLKADTVIIAGCSSLTSIEGVEAKKALISSCALLETVGKLSAQDITLIKCQKLNPIEMPAQATRHIIDCPLLDSGPIEADTADMGAPGTFYFVGDPDNPQDMTIEGDGNLEQIEAIFHVRKLTIKNCNLIEQINNLSGIEELIIDRCFSLRSITSLFNVKKITISNCRANPKIEAMEIDGDESLENLEDIPSVKELTIKNCSSLTSIGALPHIKQLTISNCPSLKRIGAIWEISIMTTIKALFRPFENLLKVFNSPFSKIEFQNCPSLNAIGQFPKWLWMGFYSIYRFFKER